MSIWSLGTKTRLENQFLFKLKVDTFALETHLETDLVSVQLWSSHVKILLIKERMMQMCVIVLCNEEIYSEKKGQYMRKHLLDKVLEERNVEVVAGWWEAVIIWQ